MAGRVDTVDVNLITKSKIFSTVTNCSFAAQQNSSIWYFYLQNANVLREIKKKI